MYLKAPSTIDPTCGPNDYLELGGSSSLESGNLEVSKKVCSEDVEKVNGVKEQKDENLIGLQELESIHYNKLGHPGIQPIQNLEGSNSISCPATTSGFLTFTYLTPSVA